ncbi:MAG: hypothetical protein R3C97_13845 [Geminicoccaceae bacterium]
MSTTSRRRSARPSPETISHSENLPVPVARQLASDDIEIAGPILASSPVLSDPT